jgi:CheY-like chemotaxis protein
MNRNHIHPFYFPTTIACVDDNANFLANLSLQLDESLSFRLFESPLDALEAISTANTRPSLTQSCFSVNRDAEALSGANRVIDLNVDKIHREVYNEERFSEVSVVVADYAMAEMDGLELCRSIPHPAVKKILLTGRADEKLAVDAFNAGLIDRFIMKSDARALANLNQAIGELQHDYFRELEGVVADALAIGTESLLRDARLAAFFHALCREREIVEFYLCANPAGFLMLNAHGAGTLLLLYTEQELQAQYEAAFDAGAPDALLDQLKSGRYVPYFWQTGGAYRGDYRNWRDFVHPATELQAKQWYYYALIDNPAPLKLDTVLCYRAFLNGMDARGQALRPPPHFSSLQQTS